MAGSETTASRRSEFVTIRLIPADLVLIEAAAEEKDVSRSTFIGTAAKRWAAAVIRDDQDHSDEESDDAGAD